MKKPFQVGDRALIKMSRSVNGIGSNGNVIVEIYAVDGTKFNVSVPIKRCTRLIKRKRREFWIERWVEGSTTHYYSHRIHDYNPEGLSTRYKEDSEIIHVRECGK